MDYGKRIKELRMQHGFSQQALADKAGTAKGTIQQYEAGKRQPRLEQLGKIADALEVPLSEILGISEQDTAQAQKLALYREKAKEKLEAAKQDGAPPDMIENFEQIIALAEESIMELAAQPVVVSEGDKKPLNQNEDELLTEFAKLSEEGQRIAIGRIKELAQIPAYCPFDKHSNKKAR